MLKNKEALGADEPSIDDKVGQLVDFGHGVWGVGEDEIVSVCRALYELQGIAVYDMERIGNAKLLSRLDDEPMMNLVPLDRRDIGAATRGKLIGDGARACEEVEHLNILEINDIGEDIEYVFFGKVGCWPGIERLGRVETSPTELAANYAHRGRRKRALNLYWRSGTMKP